MKNTITEHPPLPFSLGRNHHAPSIVYTFIFTLNALMELITGLHPSNKLVNFSIFGHNPKAVLQPLDNQ